MILTSLAEVVAKILMIVVVRLDKIPDIKPSPNDLTISLYLPINACFTLSAIFFKRIFKLSKKFSQV